MILFIKHIDIEGPETIGGFFTRKGYLCRTIDLSAGDHLPTKETEFQNIEAVICLGGPMDVYQEKEYPFLKSENIFIKKVLDKNIPYLGICLGAQLLAKASEAKVTKNPAKEIGWFPVRLTGDGKKDPIFHGIGDEFPVFQWHEDTFAIPREGKHLAGSSLCPHQALKVGNRAYGFQFHIEITDKSIREWTEEYFAKDPETLQTKKKQMLKYYEDKKESFHRTAEKIYENFLKIFPADSEYQNAAHRLSSN